MLRVGIDSGCGGTLGPIFADGTFEYVPIPENPRYVSRRSVYFRDLPARQGGTLAQYVPRRYRDGAAHYDPEFDTFTYGDPGRNKRSQLLRLSDGDLLIFYAGLRPVGVRTPSRLYIIGYFTVASVETVGSRNSWPPRNASHLLGNAHLRRNRPDDGLVVVRGDPQTSQLLDRTIVISDEAQRVTPETEKGMGIHGSLQRSIGRWVPTERIENVFDWIIQRGAAHDRTMRTLIYKRTHSGDPDRATGVFGNNNCMRRVRGWSFGAVIGVGGIGQRPKRESIARKLTWVGIGPHKRGNPSRPLVTFDHFLYYGEKGPLFKTPAPALAERMYGGKVRVIFNSSLSAKARKEVNKILDTARTAPPSPARLQDAPRKLRPKTSGCR